MYFAKEFHPRVGILRIVAFGVSCIGDDPEHVFLVLFIEFHGLFVGACQHNLRPSAHAQCALVPVERLGGEIETLLQHELVEFRQDRGVETYAVFHKQYHLHTHFLHVVFQVHLVLDELDDGQQQVGVPQPAEDIFEDAEVFVLHAGGDAVAERREHHQWQFLIAVLYGAGNVKDVGRVGARHDDDEVETVDRKVGIGLGFCGYQCEARRVAKSKRRIFVEKLLFDAAVILEHEGIVRIGDEQYIEDALEDKVHIVGILEIKLVEFQTAKHRQV